MSNQFELTQKQSKNNYVIDKSMTIFSFINIFAIIFAAFFSVYLTVSLGLLFCVSILFITSEWGKNWIDEKVDKIKFYFEIKPYLKAAKSLNHSTTLMGKFLRNMPVKQGETEVDSYTDIMNNFGEKWPFMKEVANTRSNLITVEGKPVKCVSSYNYLNFGRDERCQKSAIDAAEKYSSGNHGPRMLCGNLEILEELENKIAKFYKKESALVFNSGFLACMSAICGIARKNDLVLMDKLNHASLRYGCKCSSAKTAYFKHNDYVDAEKQIKKAKFDPKKGKLIVVTEGIFSMDGDLGYLDKARMLADKYNGILICDEAHSLGTVGKTGRGLEELYEYKYICDIIVGTFSKTISSVGGFITCSKKMRDYLCFYSPGLVFSAPLSAYHCGAAIKAFELIDEEPERMTKCQENGDYLRKKLKENNFDIGVSETIVVPVIFSCIDKIIRMHANLLKKGYFTACVMAPACPLDASRLRLCATSDMNKEDIDEFVKILKEVREEEVDNERFKRLTKHILPAK